MISSVKPSSWICYEEHPLKPATRFELRSSLKVIWIIVTHVEILRYSYHVSTYPSTTDIRCCLPIINSLTQNNLPCFKFVDGITGPTERPLSLYTNYRLTPWQVFKISKNEATSTQHICDVKHGPVDPQVGRHFRQTRKFFI